MPTDSADWASAEAGSILAMLDDYSALVAALRSRKAALDLTFDEIEKRTGLTTGYASKLLSPTHIKTLGPLSMGLLLKTLGLRLAIVAGDRPRPGVPKRHHHAEAA
jgi:hypothetical protein